MSTNFLFMDIQNFNTLITTVQSSSKEDAGKLVKQYADIRVEKAIEQAWKNFRKVLNRVTGHRKQKFRDHILNYDETSGAVPMTELVKFFAAIEDELIAQQEDAPEEVKIFAENLQDFMWNKLGADVKIDRRIIT